MKKKHLLLFTIGPVQGFIAQARKTRDLFGASELLSLLVRFVMDGLIEQDGKIIFPASDKRESLPNRFIAEWEGESDKMKTLAQNLEKKLREHWVAIGEEVFNRHHLQWRKVEQEQMANHLEVYWLAIPIIGTGKEAYTKTFALLERWMGARKNVREFKQLNPKGNHDFGETGRKCSLDGTNNAVVIRPNNRRGNTNAQMLKYAKNSIEKHEGLSAISFTKRNYLSRPFNSTAKIAFADTLHSLEEAFPNIKEDIKLLNKVDEQIWGEPQLRPSLFERWREDLEPALLEQFDEKAIRDKWTAIKAIAEACHLRFTKYYAVLLFDGDNMGKWLSGSEQYVKPGIDLELFHQAFSEKLNLFAEEAKNIVEGGKFQRGQCVYTGGDDFLGLINLNHLLPLLKEIRLAFRKNVHLPLAEKYLRIDQELSFSAGVCIAGVKEPLRVVLEYTRYLEKEANRKFKAAGKNAIAVGFIKGAGELRETYWQQYLRTDSAAIKLTVSHFIRIFQLLASDKFSEDFIRTLDREMRTLGIPREDIACEEISRLVYRKYKASPGEAAELKTNYCEELKTLLLELYEQNPRAWENFLSALYMCSFLKDKLNFQYHHDDL